MAITITIADIREFAPDLAEVGDATINSYLCLVNKMDECLDSSYPADDCTQKVIKLNAISHFMIMTTGKFVKSQSAPSGAGRSFDYFAKLEGMRMTNYGRILQMVDTGKCFELMFPQGDTFTLVGLGGSDCEVY